jgi:amino acid transporter
MVAMMLNIIIGAGIFGLPSHIHALAGPAGIFAYVVCAILIGCIALCFAEVSSRFDGTGGPYLYGSVAFGPVAGFLVGWLMWVARVAALATVSGVMASYLSLFWAPAGAGIGRAIAIAAVLLTLTAINLAGVRPASGAISVLAIGKLIPLVLFVGAGIFFLDPHRFVQDRAPVTAAFSQAVLQLIFAFGGFEAAVIAAGETHEPRRDMPFAVLFATATTTLLYLAIQIVCIGTLPSLATSDRPLADAAAHFAGAGAAAVITTGALISTVGALGSSLLLGPRLLFAMAEQGQFPAALGRTDARFRAPQLAILLTAAAALGLALTGTFVTVLNLSVLARLASYLITAAALFALRRSPSAPPARFVLRGAAPIAIIAIAASLWLVVQSGAREIRGLAIWIAAGLLLRSLTRSRPVRASR